MEEEFNVIAILDYCATEEDVLDLKEGQQYTVFQIAASGWWYATNMDGEEGWIPSNYVQRINIEKKETETQFAKWSNIYKKKLTENMNSLNTELWVMGEFQHNECWNESGDDFHCLRLTLSKWTQNIKNITKIIRGSRFNIFEITLPHHEFIISGYMREQQQEFESMTETKHNPFYQIPQIIQLICLQFVGIYKEYWSVGRNEYGQCGTGRDQSDDKQTVLKQVKDIENIEKVCIGIYGESVLWFKYDGGIYVNGHNGDDMFNYHLLGIHHKDDKKGSVLLPKLSNYFKNKGLKCIDGAISESYAVIICNDGSAWSSGSDSSGCLGHGSNHQKLSEFKQIESLKGYSIISVCVGEAWTMFLDKMGNVFSCGANSNGQLGRDSMYNVNKEGPTKIMYFEKNKIKIKRIDCGRRHCIASDINGKMYGWGDNKDSQCGLDSTIKQNIWCPQLIISNKQLLLEYVVDVKCGGHHSGCITKKGNVYLFGRNDDNECCYIDVDNTKSYDEIKDEIKEPYCINQYVYNKTGKKRIIDFQLGWSTTMIIIDANS